MDGWDDDQHAKLGRLLRSKYSSALAVLERAETSIAQLAPNVPSDKLEKFLEYEAQYLATLEVEDPEDTMAVEYLDLHEHLETLESEYEKHWNLFIPYQPPTGDLRKAAATNRIKARVHGTLQQPLTLQQAVADFEEKHKISVPWTCDMKEWIDAEEIQRNQDIQWCIDDLERLSIQRIFELSRAGIRGLGYKLCMHIIRAVNNCSTALESALNRYNKAVTKVGLQPMLWDMLVGATVLADFALLRGSRTGVLEEEWALPSNRRAAEEHQRILRAKEEILRLNVEVRHVHTVMLDEGRVLPEMAEQVAQASPQLKWAMDRYVERRLKTGMRDPGVQIGSQHTKEVSHSPLQPPSSGMLHDNTLLEASNALSAATPNNELDSDNAGDVGTDDEACDDFDKVQTVLESVSM